MRLYILRVYLFYHIVAVSTAKKQRSRKDGKLVTSLTSRLVALVW
jgi:hypothetical protein